MAPPRSDIQHARALVVIGLPLVGSHLAQLAISITDTVMLGRYSAETLAPATLAFSLGFVLFIVGTGFSLAVLPMVAQAAAEKDDTQIRRVTRMGLWISTLYGAAVMPLMIWSAPLLKAMGQSPELAGPTADYLRLFSMGIIPSLLVMVLKNYLAALERTQAVLWITLVAAVFNGGLNYVFIFGTFGAPELGLRGAALASVAMQFASLAMIMAYVVRVAPEHAMFQRLWRPDIDAFKRVFQLGWPIGLTSLAESGLFFVSTFLMGWIGAVSLAAHGIALQLASITFVFHVGLSQAATVRASTAVGHRDGRELRDGARVATLVSIAFALLTVVVFLAVPEQLVGLYLRDSDPLRDEVIAIGAILVIYAALFQLVDGAQVVALGLLRGLQDTRAPMVIAAISYWVVGIPCSLLLGFTFDLGGPGIWMGLVFGLTVAAFLLSLRFWRTGVSRYPLPA